MPTQFIPLQQQPTAVDTTLDTVGALKTLQNMTIRNQAASIESAALSKQLEVETALAPLRIQAAELQNQTVSQNLDLSKQFGAEIMKSQLETEGVRRTGLKSEMMNRQSQLDLARKQTDFQIEDATRKYKWDKATASKQYAMQLKFNEARIGQMNEETKAITTKNQFMGQIMQSSLDEQKEKTSLAQMGTDLMVFDKWRTMDVQSRQAFKQLHPEYYDLPDDPAATDVQSIMSKRIGQMLQDNKDPKVWGQLFSSYMGMKQEDAVAQAMAAATGQPAPENPLVGAFEEHFRNMVTKPKEQDPNRLFPEDKPKEEKATAAAAPAEVFGKSITPASREQRINEVYKKDSEKRFKAVDAWKPGTLKPSEYLGRGKMADGSAAGASSLLEDQQKLVAKAGYFSNDEADEIVHEYEKESGLVGREGNKPTFSKERWGKRDVAAKELLAQMMSSAYPEAIIQSFEAKFGSDYLNDKQQEIIAKLLPRIQKKVKKPTGFKVEAAGREFSDDIQSPGSTLATRG